MTTEEEMEPLDLSEWRVDEPGEDFVAAVMVRHQDSRSRRAGRLTGVVPLLLVAMFLSAGAFAAWGSQSSGTEMARTEAAPRVTSPRDVSLHHSHPMVAAEREQSRRVVTQVKPPKAKTPATEAKAQAERKRLPKLHLPSCECGVAAAICSCVDSTFVRDKTKR